MAEKAITVDDRLAELEKTLAEYERSIGLDVIKFKERYEEVFLLDELTLNSLSSEDCCTKAFVLLQYSLFLQKESNKHTRIANWADSNIKVVLGKIVNNYGGDYSPYEQRKVLAIADNIYANALNKLYIRAKNMVDTLAFLSARVTDMSHALQELSKSKRRTEYGKDRVN